MIHIIYLNISAWAQPTFDNEVNYNRIIKDINKKIKQNLFVFLNSDEYNEFSQDRTIVDLDIRESGIKFGKRSFISCEITLFLISDIQVTSEYTKIKLDKIINNIINNILDDNKFFSFHKKKI